MVSDWRRQRFETRECVGEGGPGSWRERCASRACLASRAIARHAADSWHLIYRALGRKRRSGEAQINSGRVESDRCFGGPRLTGCQRTEPEEKGSELNSETVRGQATRRRSRPSIRAPYGGGIGVTARVGVHLGGGVGVG